MRKWVSPVEIRLLRVVWALRNDWDGGWVTSYDIAHAIEKGRCEYPYRTDVRYIGMSMLPVMARAGVLETQRRCGCVVMYRVSAAGKKILRKRNIEDGAEVE